MLFSNAIAQSTVTWPTLPSIMTSTYPETHGVLENKMLIDLSVPTIAEILKENGFATAAFVSNLCKKERTKLQDEILIIGKGFERRFCSGSAFIDSRVPQEMWDKHITLNAINWLKDNRDRKFFVWLHYINPHNPYQPPQPYDRIFDPDYNGSINGSNEQLDYIPKKRVNLTDEDYNHMIALYDGEILTTDEYIGQLLSAVEEYNLQDNTLIIISADHGEGLYEHFYYFKHGCTLYDGELKVPLIMKLPSVLPEGRVIDDQVESIDITPTILEILGMPRGEEMQGRSLVPLALGGNDSIGEDYTGEEGEYNDTGSDTDIYAYSQLSNKIYSIRTNQWKYIYNPEGIKPCRKVGRFDIEKEELYNIKDDPKETKNLISSEKEVAERLRSQLLRWKEDVRRNETAVRRPVDKETEEMLKALGYVV